MKRYALLLITAILLLGACAITPSAGTESFFIQRNGAVLPVWIRGNAQSRKILLILHGGPGASDYYYVMRELYSDIEKEFLIVYTDQRGSGISQGNASPESFTLEEFCLDIDLLTDIVSSKYPDRELYLLGHSWGGFLGTRYLLDTDRQSRFSGWIEVDGAHNPVDRIPLSRQWVIEKAAKLVREGKTEYQAVLDWYTANPAIHGDNYFEHVRYVRKCGGYKYNTDLKYSETDTEYFRFSQFAYWQNMDHINSDPTLTKTRSSMNLSPRMGAITIPSLILWGAHDGIIPVQMAQDAYDSLGTPEDQKKIVIFDQSAHSPHYEENEKFCRTVIDFLRSY